MTEARVGLPKPKLAYVPSSAEVASDYIRTLVFTGVLRSGDKVPVDDIAEALHISRQPVREALIELSHDGLVHTDGRRGTFVADFGPSIIRDHYELYGMLQSFAVRRVATDANPAVLAALRELADAAERTADVAEVSRLAIEFVRTVNRAADNARLRQVIKAMTRFTPGEYYLEHIPDALQRNRDGMRRELAAIERGNPDEAGALALARWTETGEELVQHLQRTGVFHDADHLEPINHTNTNTNTDTNTRIRS